MTEDIEHLPWRGSFYSKGVNKQRVAIVGYSHRRSLEEADNAEFTRSVVRQVIDGEQKSDAFFTAARNAFDYKGTAAFWERVLFFNFLPNCIGTDTDTDTDTEKYGVGTAEQIARAKARFLRILRQEQPDKVFVFTRRGWRDCPLTLQEQQGLPCFPLTPELPDFTWGVYAAGGHAVTACGLRHPQRIDNKTLQLVVRKILKLRP